MKPDVRSKSTRQRIFFSELMRIFRGAKSPHKKPVRLKIRKSSPMASKMLDRGDRIVSLNSDSRFSPLSKTVSRIPKLSFHACNNAVLIPNPFHFWLRRTGLNRDKWTCAFRRVWYSLTSVFFRMMRSQFSDVPKRTLEPLKERPSYMVIPLSC